MRLNLRKSWAFGWAFLLMFFSNSCSNSSSPKSSGASENFNSLGTFVANYDATTGSVEYMRILPDQPLGSTQALSYTSNSTGLTYCSDYNNSATCCAIRDTSKAMSDVNGCMALVDPDSCATDWNPTTKTLSFYTKLVNKSNYANDGSPYTYPNPSVYAPNTTYYAPFYMKLIGLEWDTGTYPVPTYRITAVNTNLAEGECGANGLSLTNDDDNTSSYFDCIYPEQTFDMSDSPKDPGWDFTPFVSAADMTPGEDTGCVQFMQFTLSREFSFSVYFDLLAVASNPGAPPTPVVTAPSGDPTYVRTTPQTITINNCSAGRTLTVEGGASTASVTCTGTTQNISVDMKLNQTNNLSIYQVQAGLQSPAATKTIYHDNVAPTIVGGTPANGETEVSENDNCVISFSEAMKTSTFTVGTNCSTGSMRMCQSTTFFTGAISFSTDSTQAVYNPTSSLGLGTSTTCTVTTGVTDLAGNPLASTNTNTFTTRSGASGADVTRPYILATYPIDNQTVPLNTSFTLFFSEPINSATLGDTDCEGTAETVSNITLFELGSCFASPGPVSGTSSINAKGDIVTFTPSTTLGSSECYGFIVQPCVADLSGNQLASRGSRAIGAFGGEQIPYNSYLVLNSAASSDSTGPTTIAVGPVLNATNVLRTINPFWVFNEPISAATLTSSNVYMTKFGDPTKLSQTLEQGQSLQTVTYAPTSNLVASQNYVMTLTGNVADTSGNLMSAPKTSNFTTYSSTDTTAPTVLSVTPTNVTTGANVSKCSSFDIRFSEPVDPNTVNGTIIRLVQVSSGATKASSLTLSQDRYSVRLTPDSSLQSSGGGATARQFNVRITTGLKDRAGNSLASAYTSTTYTAVTETTAPTVLGIAPPTGSTIAQNASWVIYFSEKMDSTTLTASNFTASAGCSGGAGGAIIYVSTDLKYAIANCLGDMTSGASGTLTVSSNVRDYYNSANNASCEGGVGNTMAANQTATYTVSSSRDTTAPTVSSVSPVDLSTSVATSTSPTITFNEEIIPTTISDDSIFLMDEQGNRVPAVISISSNSKTITLDPVSDLAASTFYYVIATTAIRDLQGGNAYDGLGGENTTSPNIDDPDVLKICFSTSSTPCP